MAGVTRSSSVASTIVPVRLPPPTSTAPRRTASAIRASIRSAAARSTIEPSTTWPRGSPAGRLAALAASPATKASATASSTTNRSVDMQIWPWFRNAPKAAAATAWSRSASSSTTKGALPPSSSSTGLRCAAARPATILPTLVEPVKLTRRTAGWAISAATTAAPSAGALEITFTTPGGKPASLRTCPTRWWVAGQVSEARSTTVLPQASAAATARVARITGAFQGARPSTTPAGWRIAMDRVPGLSDGMISPVICVVSAAASLSMPAARCTLKPAQGAVAPVSSSISRAKSAARPSMRSAAFASRARRVPGPVSDQAAKARAADPTTSSTSAGVAAAARVATWPVTGSRRSKVAPCRAAADAPSTMKPMFSTGRLRLLGAGGPPRAVP